MSVAGMSWAKQEASRSAAELLISASQLMAGQVGHFWAPTCLTLAQSGPSVSTAQGVWTTGLPWCVLCIPLCKLLNPGKVDGLREEIV